MTDGRVVSNDHATATWVRLLHDQGDNRAIDGFELVSARRALSLLKAKLGRAGLLELLQDEITAGDDFLRAHLARSGDEQTVGTTMLRAHGISANEFGTWLAAAFDREDVMLAGHPEHWAIHAEPGHGVNIVETLGDQICSFFMRPWDASRPDPGTDDGPARSTTRRSHMLLADGTSIGSITNTFEEAPDGFTAELSVALPATCAPEVVDQHLEHFAVEFRTWILRAAAEKN